jgi:hypothetical protein
MEYNSRNEYVGRDSGYMLRTKDTETENATSLCSCYIYARLHQPKFHQDISQGTATQNIIDKLPSKVRQDLKQSIGFYVILYWNDATGEKLVYPGRTSG